MENKTIGIHITKEASDTKIEDCEFIGFNNAIKNEGTRTKIIRSIFKTAQSLLPKSVMGQILIGVAIALISGIVLWLLKIN
ncbi:MAG: hypothetical protein WCO65_01020 [bacterium]